MELAEARYVSLATFRRSGEAVATPVWFVSLHGSLYVFTAGGAGKVKRLRASDRARVAPCDARGRVRGAWAEARGNLVIDPDEAARAFLALRARYGWQMWLTDVLARCTGRIHRRAVIRLVLDPSTPGTESIPRTDGVFPGQPPPPAVSGPDDGVSRDGKG